METYIEKHFKMDFKPMANEGAVFQGACYRIAFLTSRIVRLEYSLTGCFEDRPSQTFWYREQEVPALSVKEDEHILEVVTDHLRLKYLKEQPFSGDTLSIELKYSCQIWRYGTEEQTNLGGTARTLDAVDGALKLEKGLNSREGYVIIDDSKSLVFNEASWLEPRTTNSTDLYFFGYGTAYKECIADYCKLTGRTQLLPRYALGNWWSRYWEYSDTELEGLMNRFESEGIPLSVCIIDMDWHNVNIDPKYGSGWTGYTWNKNLFKDPKAFMTWLHDKGLRTSLNLHPADGIRGHEDCYESVAKYMGVDVSSEQPVPFDISSPKFMKAYFEKVHHPLEDEGVDFWWIDWQQGTNSSMKGLDPLYFLNHLHYYDLGRDGSKRPFTFSRWPGLGGHRYPIGFSGDTVVTWDSLAYQPYFTSTAANVAYGWWSHDIGGHFMGIDDSELYARWVQYGVFSPINRLHTSKGIFNRREPWRHSHEAYEVAKSFLNLRHQLVPYIYTMSYRNMTESLPFITPMYFEHPHDGKAYEYKDQYYYGSELMVAPFTAPRSKVLNRTFKEVWLPRGQWFDFFTGEAYRGDNIYAMYGKLEEIPVFAKAGAIVPMAKLEQTNQIDNPEHLELVVFGGASNSFTMYEDDGISREYEAGHSVLTTFDLEASDTKLIFKINEPVGDLNVIPVNRQYTVKFRGVASDCECFLNGEESDFNYDVVTRTLSVMVDSADSIIEVRHQDLYHQEIDVDQLIFELVQDATIIMDENQRFEHWSYGILGTNLSLEEKMMRVLAMPVNDEVRRAVLAILTKALMK